jgi:hypothetical protein
MRNILIIGFVIFVLIICTIIYFKYYGIQNSINNFSDCVQAGNPVVESYPRKCNYKGQTYTEELPKEIKPTNISQPSKTETDNPKATIVQTANDKLCGWVDKSDVIIKVNIPDGIKKDTSYEAGFVYRTGANSIEQRIARLARSACDYRTGFARSELTKLTEARVGVWGYTDSVERQIKKQPMIVNFLDGLPKEGNLISVEIVN